MTTSVRSGMVGNNTAIRCRNTRLVRLRTTALPTALDTTSPTRLASADELEAVTTSRGPAARPERRLRNTAEKSALSRSRLFVGSTIA